MWHFARKTMTRVTTDPGLDESPVWTPDGRRLVFTSQVGGVLGSLFWQGDDGTGTAEPLLRGEHGIVRAFDVLPDGSAVLFSDGQNVMKAALDGSRQVQPVQRLPRAAVVSCTDFSRR